LRLQDKRENGHKLVIYSAYSCSSFWNLQFWEPQLQYQAPNRIFFLHEGYL
jgi:hypothetical protein